MRVTLETKKLIDTFNKVANGVDKKAAIQVNDSIKLDVDFSELRITATNTKNTITGVIDADADAIGSFILYDIPKFKKAMKYFKHWKTTIEAYNSELVFTCGNKSFKQKIKYNVDDFPKMLDFEPLEKHTTTTHKLLERYNKIKHAISKEETRPILTGVCFQDNKIIALDGYTASQNTDKKMNVIKPFVVAGDGMLLLTKCIDKKKDHALQVAIDEKYVQFKFGNITIKSKLLHGEYINIKQIIPKYSDKTLTLDVKTLKENITYLKDMRDNNNGCVIVEAQKQYIYTENGTFNADINPLESDNMDGFKIAFNPRYVLDMLKTIEGDSITLQFTTPVSPCTVVDGDTTHLVLPVRIQVTMILLIKTRLSEYKQVLGLERLHP